MRGARVKAPFEWEVQEIDKPPLENGQMLVRMEQVAICGSDFPDYCGVCPEYPLLTGGSGHEGIGIVELCPTGDYKEGERVLLWGFARERGLFQEYVSTRDEGLLRLPMDQPREKVLMSQLLGTVLRCFRKLGNILDHKVVVLGQGPAGLLFTGVLRNLGAKHIITVDPLEYRLKVSKQMGATETINPEKESVVESVSDLTNGEMADIVIEVVGGEETYGQCLDLTHRFSTVVCFGVPDKENHAGVIKLPMMEMQRRELKLVLSVNYGDNPYDDYALALDWITQKRLDMEPLVSHILPFDQIQRGFELAVDKPPADEPLKVILQF
ncbi:MAG: zinc-binding dehydrogenase [Candidatus Latescibacterota bacterium]|nr:zinc-binding dehydrogenase [Candidatus Latescibacterota bacterium]